MNTTRLSGLGVGFAQLACAFVMCAGLGYVVPLSAASNRGSVLSCNYRAMSSAEIAAYSSELSPSLTGAPRKTRRIQAISAGRVQTALRRARRSASHAACASAAPLPRPSLYVPRARDLVDSDVDNDGERENDDDAASDGSLEPVPDPPSARYRSLPNPVLSSSFVFSSQSLRAPPQ